MAKKLDAEAIELARHKNASRVTRNEEEKRQIRETIAKNRRGERKVTVITPERKEYAYQDAQKVRVAAYCRVSTAEEAQVGSFEMQVQHFTSLIETNPQYEMVKIYTDEGISGTSKEKRKGFSEMIEDRMEDGMSEEDAVAAVGSVDDIASQIIMDIPLIKIAKKRAPMGALFHHLMTRTRRTPLTFL